MLDPRLASEIELVHLVYNKYRPQQRTQRWWKFFAILHRRLLRFVQHNRVEPDSARFILDKLTPPAAYAFHAILAQGAFITLGFALLALLARVRTLLEEIVGPRPSKARQSVRVPASKTLAEDEAEDIGEILDTDAGAGAGGFGTNIGTPDMDRLAIDAGERKKSRKAKQSKHSESLDDIFGSTSKSKPKSKSKSRPESDTKPRPKSKSKSKSKQAIDDIFG